MSQAVRETILISPNECMRILGVGKSMLYENLLKREDFPCFRIGAKYFINKEKLQEWADKQIGKEI